MANDRDSHKNMHKNLVKIGRVVPKTLSQTDKHTHKHRHAHHNTPLPYRGRSNNVQARLSKKCAFSFRRNVSKAAAADVTHSGRPFKIQGPAVANKH